MEVVALRKIEKNFFLMLVVFSTTNKKKTRSVYRILRILPWLSAHHEGAGLVRLLDGWNTDSVLVPLLLTS